MTAPQCDIAVVGGTGVYELTGLTDAVSYEIDTPFGKAGSILVGKLNGENAAFLTRHGKGHKVLPTEVPFAANVFALKTLGVKYMFAVSACGSLREDYRPGDLVMIDQFIDRTKGTRKSTFFGNGIVGHVSFGHPVCMKFHALAKDVVSKACPDTKVHPKGTYVCMEGPAFSTQAESRMYQKWGGDIVGMTALTEAKLAREADIAYMCVGLVTDIDSWSDEDHADVASIMKVIAANSAKAQIFTKAVAAALLENKFESDAHSALASGLMTRDGMTDEQRTQLAPLFGKYWQ